LDYYRDLISEVTVSHLHDCAVAKTNQLGGHSSPPPTLTQVIASIHESRDE
jgi:hypothetical protein